LQQELELCKVNGAQDQQKLQEEMERGKMAEERKRNKEAKGILERRVLSSTMT
jgi:hypothetical protein